MSSAAGVTHSCLPPTYGSCINKNKARTLYMHTFTSALLHSRYIRVDLVWGVFEEITPGYRSSCKRPAWANPRHTWLTLFHIGNQLSPDRNKEIASKTRLKIRLISPETVCVLTRFTYVYHLSIDGHLQLCSVIPSESASLDRINYGLVLCFALLVVLCIHSVHFHLQWDPGSVRRGRDCLP